MKYILDIGVLMTPLSDGFTSYLNSLPTKPEGLTTWVKGTGVELKGKNFFSFGFRRDSTTSDVDLLYVRDNFLYMGAKPYDGSSTTETNLPTCL